MLSAFASKGRCCLDFTCVWLHEQKLEFVYVLAISSSDTDEEHALIEKLKGVTWDASGDIGPSFLAWLVAEIVSDFVEELWGFFKHLIGYDRNILYAINSRMITSILLKSIKVVRGLKRIVESHV